MVAPRVEGPLPEAQVHIFLRRPPPGRRFGVRRADLQGQIWLSWEELHLDHERTNGTSVSDSPSDNISSFLWLPDTEVYQEALGKKCVQKTLKRKQRRLGVFGVIWLLGRGI